MSHKCHANGCSKEVPPKLFMCLKHWRMLPRKLQLAIWREYVPGQEIRKDPTGNYLDAAEIAILAVAEREGR